MYSFVSSGTIPVFLAAAEYLYKVQFLTFIYYINNLDPDGNPVFSLLMSQDLLYPYKEAPSDFWIIHGGISFVSDSSCTSITSAPSSTWAYPSFFQASRPYPGCMPVHQTHLSRDQILHSDSHNFSSRSATEICMI